MKHYPDDRITIFNKYTYNQEYRFNGETGDNSGSFKRVDNGDFVTGNSLDNIYAIYPYLESTKISDTGVMTVTLPAEQHYAENTFGLGANTMISATTDNQLMFKNVGGYLMLKLYGDDVMVSSISLKGNNGEKLSGKATVTMPVNGIPTIEMTSDAGEEIALVCDTPVKIGTTAETATTFWMVVPSTVFSKGFTLTVKDDKNGEFQKVTSNSLSISRNVLSRMVALEVDIELIQPNNEIWYTSTNGEIVTPYASDAFGVSIVSNEYLNGKGIITFDGPISEIGWYAFGGCSTLSTIDIPGSVTSIGDFAFSRCEKLKSFVIPSGIKNIGNHTFYYCTDLASIIIPESVENLDPYAFSNCSSLQSVSIPDGVKSIGRNAFASCTNLVSINLPNEITSINDETFSTCTNLAAIDIPSSVTSIGNSAFSNCHSITSFVFPDNLTTIGRGAFYACKSLCQ